MRKFERYFVLGFLVLVSCGARQTGTQLWPEIQPYETGHLQVSDLHEIYYELCGNPQGKPVFVLHGGPGAQTSPYYRRFFDPEKFLIVLHDQRGAGRSRPLYELRENNTQSLAMDIEALRKHVKADRIILFGGSWGSTLAIAYGETYPQNVSGMVLRGIFMATAEEIAHYYGGAVGEYQPKAYEDLRSAFGDPVTPQAFSEKLRNADPEQRMALAKAWSAYESKIAYLNIPDAGVNGFLNNPIYAQVIMSLALIENHYMANGCFFEEGELFANASRLASIPVFLINGRYDLICPPVTAYRLHKILPESRLVIVEQAGHSMDERGIEKAMLEAMKSFE